MKHLFVFSCLLVTLTEGFAVSTPRRTVFFQDMNLKVFRESNFSNVSSYMVRYDTDQLVIGARGKVFTLSLDDVTKKTGEVHWIATSAEQIICQYKGRSADECHNFIRIIHMMKNGKALVCGTRAFNPSCDYMTFTNGKISLERNVTTAKMKLPFNPYESFSSLMEGNTLYSASSVNFLSTVKNLMRHGRDALKNEDGPTWLNDPTMISLNLIEVSKHSDNGDDDNLYLFFTENAMEEFRGNLKISRIARVCKSDLGGTQVFQHKWTSFFKARLHCPFGDVGSLPLVQDVFLVKNKSNWKDSIFYATFTSQQTQSGGCSHSAVCAYKLSDVSKVFSGRFLFETMGGSWEIYKGTEPIPHPTTCINDEMRANGVNSSLDLPDSTLLFVKKHHLMAGVVTPESGKPLLVRSSEKFSKIVVDKVTSPHGQQNHVMLIGTESGWLLKAVNLDGDEGHIIEELQLFKDPLPIKFLHISKTGQLYGGASDTVVQVDLRDCSRYTSCEDCILARDPYCGWDMTGGKCASASATSSWFQSLRAGNISICLTFNSINKLNLSLARQANATIPISNTGLNYACLFPPVTKRPDVVLLTVNVTQFLPCHPDANFPVKWHFPDNVVSPSPRHNPMREGLVIKPLISDAGLYTCETVEDIKGQIHLRTINRYLVQVQNPVQQTEAGGQVKMLLVITLAVVASLLLMINFLMCSFLKVKGRCMGID